MMLGGVLSRSVFWRGSCVRQVSVGVHSVHPNKLQLDYFMENHRPRLFMLVNNLPVRFGGLTESLQIGGSGFWD
jgi:hypothetical protein